MLMNEIILFDSKMKVFSTSNNTYIDTAGILTKNNLYLISAINYEIWMEFEMRTKIDDIIKNNNAMVDKNIAMELIANLDIIDDEKICESKILPYLIHKTKSEIKLDIILNEKAIDSLASLFRFSSHESISVKCINQVRIDNIDAISNQYIGDFINHIFEDIPLINQQKKHNSLIILFENYYKDSIIEELNIKKQTFCQQKNINNHTEIIILKINKNYSGSSTQRFKKIDFAKSTELFGSQYDKVEPINLINSKYCFNLNHGMISMQNGIRCSLTSNNIRHEWITHLDRVIHMHNTTQTFTVPISSHQKRNSINFINDFTFVECEKNEDEFAKDFSFGIYLDYWREGYDNSVIPIYATFKVELLYNKHATITEKQYYILYDKCLKIQQENNLKAEYIGVTNKKFKIPLGSSITINHLISLKLYTDYSKIQNVFKKHCRPQSKDEPLQNIIFRNSEIAHWCRYLKECCTFYGENMGKKTVYTGLNQKLMFDSMLQHFECPLSTTMDLTVANQFAEGTSGIILQLKAANPKTRCFDVSWLSTYPQERELLFMGSSLKIVDILIASGNRINGSDRYISAIHMFEQIVSGQFIDEDIKKENKLISLLELFLDATNMEQICSKNIQSVISQKGHQHLQHFLEEEEYDTDSILEDIDELKENGSNIGLQSQLSTEQMDALTQYINKIMSKHSVKKPSKYILALFVNFISKLQATKHSQSIWINHTILNQNNHKRLKFLFYGKNKLFDHFNINKSLIKSVQSYRWEIKDDEYNEFIKKKPRHYIESKQYSYHINGEEIKFHLRCYAKYSDTSPKCALFLHLDSLSDTINGISIEFDVICDKKSKYKHLMSTQLLSHNKRCCGFQTFEFDKLTKNTSITWIMGLKILEIQYEEDSSMTVGQVQNNNLMLETDNLYPDILEIMPADNYPAVETEDDDDSDKISQPKDDIGVRSPCSDNENIFKSKSSRRKRRNSNNSNASIISIDPVSLKSLRKFQEKVAK
eukprot:32231_1